MSYFRQWFRRCNNDATRERRHRGERLHARECYRFGRVEICIRKNRAAIIRQLLGRGIALANGDSVKFRLYYARARGGEG